jgi:hypothetical protein
MDFQGRGPMAGMSAPLEEETCTLLPGAFGAVVQGFLFLISVGVLLLKKKREEALCRIEARSWPTFLLDSSKQLVGAGWVHLVNMACALLLGIRFEGNECEWYWVNIMVDTTLGVFIEYLLLVVLTEAFEWATFYKGTFQTGEYKDETGRFLPSRYMWQLAVWLLCVTFMKFAMVIMMLVFPSGFQSLAHCLLSLVPRQDVRLQLIVVMVITPCCMNAVQFWLTDNFIKRRSNKFMDDDDDDFESDLENQEFENSPGPYCGSLKDAGNIDAPELE